MYWICLRAKSLDLKIYKGYASTSCYQLAYEVWRPPELSFAMCMLELNPVTFDFLTWKSMRVIYTSWPSFLWGLLTKGSSDISTWNVNTSHDQSAYELDDRQIQNMALFQERTLYIVRTYFLYSYECTTIPCLVNN